MTEEKEFRSAILTALDEELARDESVVFYGEDVAKPGGVFAVTPGLQEKYGSDRVFDTPISELAMTGAAFGAAVCGMRPVVEIMFGDFMPLAMDALVNQAAKYWYISDEQAPVPLVIRSAIGAGGRFGAVHSQSPIPWFLGVPGLKIVCPSTPNDARALLRSSIQDDNPVLFFEHKRLYSTKGPVSDDPIALGEAAIVREGTDLTVVTTMLGLGLALAAADTLAADGISLEVIDLRTLRPLDIPTIARSLEKTNRLLVVEEGTRLGGWSATVVAEIAEHRLTEIDDIWRITTPDTPIPFALSLEDAFLPGADTIVAEVRERLSAAGPSPDDE
jgi:acetoin:2,6-dichlorophenolindophenol oxidoreductase subunit beta